MIINSMVSVETWKKLYAEGTQGAGGKLELKFAENAALAVSKLKDPKTADTWHQKVSQQEAKDNFRGGVKNLTVEDLVVPMRERGIQNYINSTSAPSTIAKAAKGVEPYLPIAEKSKREKIPNITNADRVKNMTRNMELFQAKKKELNR